MENAFYHLMDIIFVKEREGFHGLAPSILSPWVSSSQEKPEAVQEVTNTADLGNLAPVMTHKTHRTEAQHRETAQTMAGAKRDVSGYPYLATPS